MKGPTLLVLAAGLGSRYGGLKQMEGIGPQGESLLDYSSFDALQAGFERLVFVIRKDFSDAFKTAVVDRWKGRVAVDLVYQDLDDLPGGFVRPAERVKPWGTTHAILAAKDVIKEPFLMINADDFYGRDTFNVMGRFLKEDPRPGRWGMAGFRLSETLSMHGGVTRAVCRLDKEGRLEALDELKDVRLQADGSLTAGGRTLDPNAPVSMNCFAFGPDVFPHLEAQFIEFLQQHGKEERSECLIPESVTKLVQSGVGKVDILPTTSRWMGVTFPEDRPRVQVEIGEMHKRGEFPATLWVRS